jgi:tetratricopeptide (TPR) repeat protein
MNMSKVPGLALSLWLLIAGPVGAQQVAQKVEKEAKPNQTTQMYEDIEILRRLLSSKLAGFVTTSSGKPTYYWTRSNQGMYNLVDQTSKKVIMELKDPQQAYSYLGGDAKILKLVSASIGLEGTYFKGQGVIYTVTLPQPAQDPRGVNSSPVSKPLSEWELMRKVVRQEKTELVIKPDSKKSTSLTEVILRALAANGSHFKLLGDDENLMVAITFRSPTPSGSSLSQGYPLHSYGTPKGGLFDPNRSNGSKTRDYELLGDLHLKQGRVDEAIQAYSAALKIKQGTKELAVLWQKMAKALLAKGDARGARQALDYALKSASGKTVGDPKITGLKSSALLPAKLIISAPKKVLDQVGSGKITFEAFAKAATVDYLTFSPSAK